MSDNDLRLTFRMWNEDLEKMTYFDNPHLGFELIDHDDFHIRSVLAFDIAENSALYFGAHKMVMQGLPLCDRSGRQAYEDDIIEYADTEGRIYRKRIKWDDELLCYLIGDIPYNVLFNSAYIQPSKLVFEIVGNIYQNPELEELP